MTGNVVNLRMARKRKARAEREVKAAENRVIFGETKAQKLARKANADIDRRRLDQLQRQEPADDDGE